MTRPTLRRRDSADSETTGLGRHCGDGNLSSLCCRQGSDCLIKPGLSAENLITPDVRIHSDPHAAYDKHESAEWLEYYDFCFLSFLFLFSTATCFPRRRSFWYTWGRYG